MFFTEIDLGHKQQRRAMVLQQCRFSPVAQVRYRVQLCIVMPTSYSYLIFCMYLALMTADLCATDVNQKT